MKSTAYQTLAFLADDMRDRDIINSKVSDPKNNSNVRKSCPKTSSVEKYSLRQRQKRSTIVATNAVATVVSPSDSFGTSDSLQDTTTMDPAGTSFTASSLDHKTKRCRVNCDDNDYVPSPTVAVVSKSTRTTTMTTTARQKEPKAKTKAAPLSKYRRKTANARERTRMREINSAFENLRHCVPHTITGDVSSSSNEKLTKITTLRLAMKYIKVLTEALANPTFEADFLLECKNDGDHRFTTYNWTQTRSMESCDAATGGDDSDEEEEEEDEEDGNMSDVTVPLPPVTTRTKPTRAVLSNKSLKTAAVVATGVGDVVNRKAPTKRQRNKQKLNDSISPYSSSSSSSSCSSTSSTSAYASMSSSAEASPPSNPYLADNGIYGQNNDNNHCQSMTDLSSLGLLESEGESLSCLSPLDQGYNIVGSSVSGFSATTHLSPFTTHHSGNSGGRGSGVDVESLENPLELSLQLLESSDADSLEFGTGDHQPTTCISPLVTLDSFNPFADLLHSEFSDHNALELFLT